MLLVRTAPHQEVQAAEPKPILVDFICEKPEAHDGSPATPTSNLDEQLSACLAKSALDHGKLLSLQDERDRLQTELDASNATRNVLKDQLTKLQQESDIEKAKLASDDNQIQTLRDKLQAANNELDKLRNALSPKRLETGSILVINVHHHHSKGGECSGVLEFFPGRIVFRSNEPDHKFDVPLNDVSQSFRAKLVKGQLQVSMTVSGQEYQFSDNSSDDPEDCRALRGMKLDCQQKN